ncbi:hypothetical protein BGX27_010762 [Mortierella sp. AM989]|nr:hypothetical protein BGX27_010762 [Mortierella sp. AM989]
MPRLAQESEITPGIYDDNDDLESIYEPLTYSGLNASADTGSDTRQSVPPEPPITPPLCLNDTESSSEEMEVDNAKISFKRENFVSQDLSIKNDESPATVEIENLDPSTTADDVKV